jgi:N4-gp56 family major capsid protein
MPITNSTISLDQEKFLVNKLLDRSYIKLVMAGICDMIQMREGAGLTAYMVRYKRMNVPVTTLSEGVIPSESTFSLEEVTVTLDQWGDYLSLTDVAQLTVKHPLMTQCAELLADNAARVMDREITIVLMSGTNVQFGDGSVITRGTIDASMRISDAVIGQIRVTLVSAGAPPRGGPSGDARQTATSGNFQNGLNYVAIAGPQVIQDVMSPATSFGTWVSAATYNNAKQLYAAEAGTWLGVRFVETNFIPRFVLFGNTTTAAAVGANAGGTGATLSVGSGTLANATYFWKMTRKDLLRGFEEFISIEHSTATAAASSSLQFVLSATAGFVYNIYLGASTGDANLRLAVQNAAAGSTNNITAVPGSLVTPPASLRNVLDGNDPSALHPVFVVAEAAVSWVGFYKPRFLMSPTGATKDDPLAQRRTTGYKFFGKTVIKDQTRLLRVELASAFA